MLERTNPFCFLFLFSQRCSCFVSAEDQLPLSSFLPLMPAAAPALSSRWNRFLVLCWTEVRCCPLKGKKKRKKPVPSNLSQYGHRWGMLGIVVQYALSTFAAEITFFKALKRVGLRWEEGNPYILLSKLQWATSQSWCGGMKRVWSEKRQIFLGGGIFGFTKLGKETGCWESCGRGDESLRTILRGGKNSDRRTSVSSSACHVAHKCPFTLLIVNHVLEP